MPSGDLESRIRESALGLCVMEGVGDVRCGREFCKRLGLTFWGVELVDNGVKLMVFDAIVALDEVLPRVTLWFVIILDAEPK